MGRLNNFINIWISINKKHSDFKEERSTPNSFRNSPPQNSSKNKRYVQRSSPKIRDDDCHSYFTSTTDMSVVTSSSVRTWPLILNEKEREAREILRSMPLEERRAFLKDELDSSAIEKQQNTRENIPMSNLKFRSRLGEGASGLTYHGNWQTKNDDSLEVAIKVAAISEHGENGWETEKELLQSFQVPHPNVIQLHGYASLKAAEKKGSKETRCLVLEYCNAGDLSTVMHLHSPPDFIMHISQSIAKGMAFLHKSSIIHRDLKPENVLLHGDRTSPRKLNVKIADLGLGKRITRRHEEHTAETGTYRYMAPEVIRHQPYSFQADVYSFGILFWQLITRETPFSDDISQIEAAGRVALHKIRPPFPEGTPKCVVDLINLCWHENPNKRPTFDEIVITLDQIEKGLSAKEKAWLDEPYGHNTYSHEVKMLRKQSILKRTTSKIFGRRRSIS